MLIDKILSKRLVIKRFICLGISIILMSSPGVFANGSDNYKNENLYHGHSSDPSNTAIITEGSNGQSNSNGISLASFDQSQFPVIRAIAAPLAGTAPEPPAQNQPPADNGPSLTIALSNWLSEGTQLVTGQNPPSGSDISKWFLDGIKIISDAFSSLLTGNTGNSSGNPNGSAVDNGNTNGNGNVTGNGSNPNTGAEHGVEGNNPVAATPIDIGSYKGDVIIPGNQSIDIKKNGKVVATVKNNSNDGTEAKVTIKNGKIVVDSGSVTVTTTADSKGTRIGLNSFGKNSYVQVQGAGEFTLNSADHNIDLAGSHTGTFQLHLEGKGAGAQSPTIKVNGAEVTIPVSKPDKKGNSSYSANITVKDGNLVSVADSTVNMRLTGSEAVDLSKIKGNVTIEMAATGGSLTLAKGIKVTSDGAAKVTVRNGNIVSIDSGLVTVTTKPESKGTRIGLDPEKFGKNSFMQIQGAGEIVIDATERTINVSGASNVNVNISGIGSNSPVIKTKEGDISFIHSGTGDKERWGGSLKIGADGHLSSVGQAAEVQLTVNANSDLTHIKDIKGNLTIEMAASGVLNLAKGVTVTNTSTEETARVTISNGRIVSVDSGSVKVTTTADSKVTRIGLNLFGEGREGAVLVNGPGEFTLNSANNGTIDFTEAKSGAFRIHLEGMSNSGNITSPTIMVNEGTITINKVAMAHGSRYSATITVDGGALKSNEGNITLTLATPGKAVQVPGSQVTLLSDGRTADIVNTRAIDILGNGGEVGDDLFYLNGFMNIGNPGI